jgi:purine-binding chemotaxis protein CheW
MNQVYLSFNISDELYGINVLEVLEVLQKQIVTEVPNSPAYINGIINFRGEVVPVYDMRVRFNLEPRNENSAFVIAVLDLTKNGEPFRIGAIVDSVRDVITISDDDIKPAPPMSNKLSSEFIKGIVRRDDRFILLIDVNKVFTEDKITEEVGVSPIE